MFIVCGVPYEYCEYGNSFNECKEENKDKYNYDMTTNNTENNNKKQAKKPSQNVIPNYFMIFINSYINILFNYHRITFCGKIDNLKCFMLIFDFALLIRFNYYFIFFSYPFIDISKNNNTKDNESQKKNCNCCKRITCIHKT